MKLGTLEVERMQEPRKCDECAQAADLMVDGQPQCLQHATSRLRDDPEALGALALEVVLLRGQRNQKT